MEKASFAEMVRAVQDYLGGQTSDPGTAPPKEEPATPPVVKKEVPKGELVMAAKAAGTELELIANEPLASQLITAIADILESRNEMKAALMKSKLDLAFAQRKLEEQRLEQERYQAENKLRLNEIVSLRDQLSEQNLKFDQLYEDYQMARELNTRQINQLRGELKNMKRRYEAAKEEKEKLVLDGGRKILGLENDVESYAAKYAELMEQHNSLRADNQMLLDQISSFVKKSFVGLPGGEAAVKLEARPVTKQVDIPADNNVTKASGARSVNNGGHVGSTTGAGPARQAK